jgi:hypothetical protein
VKEIAVRAPGFQSGLHRGRRYRQVEESQRSFVVLQLLGHSTCSFVGIVGNASDRQSIEVSRHSGVREYFCRLRQDLLVGIEARDVRKDESPHAGGRGKLGRFRRGEMAVFEGQPE